MTGEREGSWREVYEGIERAAAGIEREAAQATEAAHEAVCRGNIQTGHPEMDGPNEEFHQRVAEQIFMLADYSPMLVGIVRGGVGPVHGEASEHAYEDVSHEYRSRKLDETADDMKWHLARAEESVQRNMSHSDVHTGHPEFDEPVRRIAEAMGQNVADLGNRSDRVIDHLRQAAEHYRTAARLQERHGPDASQR